MRLVLDLIYFILIFDFTLFKYYLIFLYIQTLGFKYVGIGTNYILTIQYFEWTTKCNTYYVIY